MVQKDELHPRNRHRDRYDFPKLIRDCPGLAPFVAKNKYGDDSIDFADPTAVKALNRALLFSFYGVREWDIPEGYLCPPIPGRADYLHHAAALVPNGPARVLDVGTGANLVYPLIGHREYGWTFVATDIDRVALESAAKILEKNPEFQAAIELRLQSDPNQIFTGVVRPGEKYALAISNPPFHASREDAEAASRRKWNGLGRGNTNPKAPIKNFGGTSGELWCEGGERAFVTRMIAESARFRSQIAWFSSLVSKEENLDPLEKALTRAGVRARRVLPMGQGQKKSRIIAWSF